MLRDKEWAHLIKRVQPAALLNVMTRQPRTATMLKNQITHLLTKTHYFATFKNAKELGVVDL